MNESLHGGGPAWDWTRQQPNAASVPFSTHQGHLMWPCVQAGWVDAMTSQPAQEVAGAVDSGPSLEVTHDQPVLTSLPGDSPPHISSQQPCLDLQLGQGRGTAAGCLPRLLRCREQTGDSALSADGWGAGEASPAWTQGQEEGARRRRDRAGGGGDAQLDRMEWSRWRLVARESRFRSDSDPCRGAPRKVENRQPCRPNFLHSYTEHSWLATATT